jgi:hypothetical protein
MQKRESITSIIFRRLIKFVIFIILLVLANLVISYIPRNISQIYTEIINFFNLNVALFILLLFLDILNAIFWNFNFPFNLFAPTISSVFGIFNVALLYNMWSFVNQYINSEILIPIYTIYILVAVIIFVWGYIHIFIDLKKEKEVEKEYRNELKEIKKLSSNKKKSNLKWNDVNGQFKNLFYNLEEQLKIVLYNIGDALNTSFEKEKKKQKRKKRK